MQRKLVYTTKWQITYFYGCLELIKNRITMFLIMLLEAKMKKCVKLKHEENNIKKKSKEKNKIKQKLYNLGNKENLNCESNFEVNTD